MIVEGLVFLTLLAVPVQYRHLHTAGYPIVDALVKIMQLCICVTTFAKLLVQGKGLHNKLIGQIACKHIEGFAQ